MWKIKRGGGREKRSREDREGGERKRKREGERERDGERGRGGEREIKFDFCVIKIGKRL